MVRGWEGSIALLLLEERLEGRIKWCCGEGGFEGEGGGYGRDLGDGEGETTGPRANRMPLISRIVHTCKASVGVLRGRNSGRSSVRRWGVDGLNLMRPIPVQTTS